MSPFFKSFRNLFIMGFFIIGALVAAGSFGLFGCTCPEQNRRDPPTYKPAVEPIWSTSQGSKP